MLKERNKQIIKLYKGGESKAKLAREYKLSRTRISQIVDENRKLTIKEIYNIKKRDNYTCQWKHTCKRAGGVRVMKVYTLGGYSMTLCDKCHEEAKRQWGL